MNLKKFTAVGAAGMMVFGGTAAQAATGFNSFYAGNPCVSSLQGCVLPVSRPAPVAVADPTPVAAPVVAEESGFPWLLALLGAAAIAGAIILLSDDDDDVDTTPVST